MGRFGVGQAVPRVEDQRLLTGAGKYTDDVSLPGQAYAVFLRSPYAHAKILSVDVTEAKAAPGVLGIFTGEDVKAAGIGTIPSLYPLKQKDGSPLYEPPHPVLAQGVVRHVGDPVAMVVAETWAQARDAMELIVADYEDLPANTELARALDADTPQVWPDAPNNRSFIWGMGDEAKTAKAFDNAVHKVTLELINNRIVVNPMEPRAALGAYEDGRYVLYTPSQGPHSLRRQLARNIFKVSDDQVRVITGDVGGGFGMKIFLYPEQPMVLFAAKAIGRPVKWTAERSTDGFLSDIHGRDHVTKAELALDADYRFTGLRVHTIANLGAYISNFGAFIPTGCCAPMLPGVYATPAMYYEVDGVFTNTVPVDAYRGAGRPEATYLLERLVDKAARDLGVDPVELRMKNYIKPEALPYTTPTDKVYDSGNFALMTERILKLTDREGFAARKAASAKAGKLRGWGMAYYIEMCGAGSGETSRMKVDSDGVVTLFIGTQSNGQGHETAYTQIIADRMGLDPSQIRIVQGDTDTVITGNGTGGSRSIPEGGPGVYNATELLKEKAIRIAASVLEADAADVEFADGAASVVGTDRRMSLADIAKAAQDPAHLADGEEPGLNAEASYKSPEATFPNGAHVCELEVDPETGTVAIQSYTVCDDFGTVLNPNMLAGQVHGGIAQGLGQALMEHTVYDPASGQLLSGSFMDYTMPRADTVPSFKFHYFEDMPCATNPMGLKGAGEAGAIGAPPAAINAIVDALSIYGINHIDMPATPLSIWQAIQHAERARAAE